MPSPWARHAPRVDTEPLRDQCTGNPGDKEAVSARACTEVGTELSCPVGLPKGPAPSTPPAWSGHGEGPEEGP